MLSRNALESARFVHIQTLPLTFLSKLSTLSPLTSKSLSLDYADIPSEHLLNNRSQASRTFRHLLRALLREATYLPDPAARKHYRSHIIDRFRRNRTLFVREDEKRRRIKSNFLGDSKQGHEKQLQLLVEGKKQLRALARANVGHVEPLMRVLKNTYGRIGKRRSWLLVPWVSPDLVANPIAPDTQSVQSLLKQINGTAPTGSPGDLTEPNQGASVERSDALHGAGMNENSTASDASLPPQVGTSRDAGRLPPKAEMPELSEPLKALIKAQITSALDPPWTTIKPAPVIPKSNAWLQPVPMRRQRNIIQQWKNSVLALLLPPLPSKQYARLLQLATGSSSDDVRSFFCLKQPKRRNAGLTSDKPAFSNAPPVHGSQDDLTTDLLHQASNLRLIRTDESHRITPRFIKRCLQRILEMTPTLQRSNDRWTAQFGRPDKQWRTLWDANLVQGNQKKRKGKPREHSKGPDNQEGSDVAPSNRGAPAYTGHWMFDPEGEELEPIYAGKTAPVRAIRALRKASKAGKLGSQAATNE